MSPAFMRNKRPSPTKKRRIVAEPLEARLLFSATADMVLLDDGLSEADDLPSQAETVNLLEAFDIPLITDAEIDNVYQDDANHNPVRESFEGEFIFVDADLENRDALIEEIKSNSDSEFEVIKLDATENGLETISLLLAQFTGVKSVHLLTHGDEARLKLGDVWVTNDNFSQHQEQLSQWQAALSDNADILIYGCDLAANDDGQQLISKIAQVTHADVAASNDVTGSTELGGDWQLEQSTGSIETIALFAPSWQGVLGVITANADSADYWHGETITGNVLTGAGGSSVTADVIASTPGEIVSVVYDGATYDTFVDDKITINAYNGTLVMERGGDYTFTSNGVSGSAEYRNWDDSFVLYGYADGVDHTPGLLSSDLDLGPASVIVQQGSSGLGNTDSGGSELDNSEIIVIDLGADYTRANVVVNGLNNNEDVNYTLFASGFSEVATGSFSGDGDGLISSILYDGAYDSFRYISIEPQEGILLSPASLYIQEVTAYNYDPGEGSFITNEVFTYTVEDADTDQQSTTLTLVNANSNSAPTLSFSGTESEGDTLTASSPSDDDGTSGSTFSYQWQRSDSGNDTWSNIAGATSADYLLTADDAGKYVRVNSSFTDDDGNVESVYSASSGIINSLATVTIDGTLQRDQTLSANISDADGHTGGITYLWERSDDGVNGWSSVGTLSNLALDSDDVGKYFRLSVSYTDDAGTAESPASTVSGPVNDIPEAQDDSGSFYLGETLTGNVITGEGGSGMQADGEGDPNAFLSQVEYNTVVYDSWDANGNLSFNTTNGVMSFNQDGSYTYTPTVVETETDVSWDDLYTVYGYTMGVAFVDGGSLLDLSNADALDFSDPNPSSDPQLRDSSTGLSIRNTADSDHLEDDGSAGGSTEAVVIDLGADARIFQVTTSNFGSTENLTWRAYDASLTQVQSGSFNGSPDGSDESIYHTEKITVSGDFQYLVFTGDTSNTNADSFRIYSLSVIDNSPANLDFDYTLSDANGDTDIGRLSFTYTDDNNAGTISISGTTNEGDSLSTAGPTDADGVSGTISYQWQRSGDGVSGWSDIGGANVSSYRVAGSDDGDYLRVVATYIDDEGTHERVVSDASTVVSAANDAPVLGNNSLTLTDGDTVILTTADLSASDADDNDDNLVFYVTSVTNGQFELVSDSSLVTEFTQAQVAAGEIQFNHDDSFNAPAYSVEVQDEAGASSGAAVAATITFTVEDAEPVLTANSLSVNEGQSVVLTTNDFAATDADNDDNTLTFNVSSVSNGTFQLVSNDNDVTSFTQQQIIDGAIKFVHDGDETAPSYLVSIFDGFNNTTPAAASISFNANENDTPVLTVNSLTVNEGQEVVLTNTDFAATDSDNTDSTLTFTVTSIANGSFQLTSDNSVVTSFTQQQLIDGDIKFVHDGGENAPSYFVSVSDGNTATTAAAATITFSANDNDTPTLTANGLNVTEGQEVVLTNFDFAATDPDNLNNSLTFNVSSVNNGSFQLVSDNSTVTSFTQQQISDGAIKFVHDGSENAPSYSVSVSDSNTATIAAAATITFTSANDAPTLAVTVTNNFTEDAGASVGDIVASYTTNDEDGDTVTVTLSDTTNYALDGSGNVTLTAAGLALVNAGTDLPAFNLTPNDGTVDGVAGNVDPAVTAANDAPTLTVTVTNNFTEDAGASVGDIVASYTTNDEEGDTVTVTLSDTTNYALDGSGNVTLTAAGLALVNAGTDLPAFTLTPNDGTVDGIAGNVDPAVTAANDAPTLTVTVTNNFTEDAGASVGDIVASYTTNDEEGDTVTVTLSDTTNYALDGSGNVTLTAAGLALVNAGTDLPAFNLTPNDGTVDGIAGNVDPSVTAANDAPTLTVTVTNNFTEDAGASVGDIVASYTTNDEEGDTVTVTLSDTTNYALDGSGNVTLTAAGLALVNAGTDLPAFTLTPNDGTVDGVAGNVDPTVTAANDAPTLTVTVTNNFTEDAGASVGDIVASYTTNDEEGDTVTVTLSDTTNYALDGSGNVTLTAAGLALVNAGTDLPAFNLTPNDGTVDGIAGNVDPTVTPSNDPGTVTITGTAEEDQLLTASVTDPEGVTGQVTYTWERSTDGTSNWTIISSADTYLLTDDDAGNYIRVRASYSDDQGFIESPVSAASSQVVSVNDPGLLTLSGTEAEDQVLSTNLVEDDGLSGPITFVWERSADGNSGWTVITGATASSYTLNDADVDQFIRVSATYTDGQGYLENLSASSGQISGTNDDPVLQNGIANQQATEDSPFTFTFANDTFFDADGDALNYSASLSNNGALPSWLSFDSASRTFSGTPTNDADAGTLEIVVFADDGNGGQRASTTFNLLITAVNDNPVSSGFSPISVDEEAPNESIALGNIFDDEETSDNNLVFAIISNSNNALFDSAAIDDNGNLLLDFSANQSGESTIIIRATDEQGAFVDSALQLSVAQVNDVPTAAPLDNIVFTVGSQTSSQISLADVFNDVEDDINDMVLSIESNSNPELISTANITDLVLNLTYTEQSVGQGTIVLRVTDTAGDIAETTLTIQVGPAPVVQPPEPEPEPEDTLPEPEEPEDTLPEPEPEEPDEQGSSDGENEQPVDDVPRSNGGGNDDNSLINQVPSYEAFLALTEKIGSAPEYDFEPAAPDTRAQENIERFVAERQNLSNTSSALANLVVNADSFLSEQDIAEFNDELLKLKEEMQLALDQQAEHDAIYQGLTISLTTGIVVWALRASSLFLTLFSMIPIWKGLDPLPVVNNLTRKQEELKQKKDKAEEDKRSGEVGYMFDKEVEPD